MRRWPELLVAALLPGGLLTAARSDASSPAAVGPVAEAVLVRPADGPPLTGEIRVFRRDPADRTKLLSLPVGDGKAAQWDAASGKLKMPAGEAYVELEGYEPLDFRCENGGKPALKPAVFTLKLPAAVAEDKSLEGKIEVRFTPAGKAELRTLKVKSTANQPVGLPAGGWAAWANSSVEVRVAGHHPVMAKLVAGSVVDAAGLKKLEDDRPFVVVINNLPIIGAAAGNNRLENLLKQAQKDACLEICSQLREAKPKVPRIAGFALVDSGRGDWPKNRDDALFRFTEERAPLTELARHRHPAEKLWGQVLELLLHPDVAERHTTIRVVVITQAAWDVGETTEGYARIKERMAAGGLKLTTMLVGTPLMLDKKELTDLFFDRNCIRVAFDRNYREQLKPETTDLVKRLLAE